MFWRLSHSGDRDEGRPSRPVGLRVNLKNYLRTEARLKKKKKKRCLRALVASLCGVVNYVVFFPASGRFLPFIASMLADSTASPRRVENEVTSTKTNLALLLYIRDLVTDRSSPDHDFLVVVACQSPFLSPSPSPPPSSVNSPTVTPLL